MKILRDPRESPKKCSLVALRGEPGIEFVRFEKNRKLDASGMILLDPAGPPLSPDDKGRTLLILDSSWRHLPELRRCLTGEFRSLSIPKGFVTAYPRRSKIFEDPASGLASVEALFLATAILGEPAPSLLDSYHWKAEFLEKNRAALAGFFSTAG